MEFGHSLIQVWNKIGNVFFIWMNDLIQYFSSLAIYRCNG